jgi:hypothetical protein
MGMAGGRGSSGPPKFKNFAASPNNKTTASKRIAGYINLPGMRADLVEFFGD